MTSACPAIGIDLGTTYSCVGAFMGGTVHIFTNEAGDRTTPSVVAFTEHEKLVGSAASAQINTNPENTVFDAKRMIGRKFTDATVQQDMTHWPFKVKQASSEMGIAVVVNYRGKDHEFRPEEISAFVLEKMKAIAENELGKAVTSAVVTVPAYFSDDQRASTFQAADIAGLKVLRIINEPTAAAIAYGLEKVESKALQHALIYDLGGGTFDVSILAIEDGIFEVKATSGDTHLGGEDFDNVMVSYCLKEFKRRSGVSESDIKPKSMRRLRTACEKAKRVLSASTSTTITVENMTADHDLNVAFTRATFEKCCGSFFDRTIEEVKNCIIKADMSKSQIDSVVLVGGSTRIVKVQQLLEEYFGKPPCKSINPDEAVAYGAAVQAAVISGNKDEKLSDVLLIDVVPIDYGIETLGGKMTPIIKANTSIPASASQVFTTAADNQSSVNICIYQGNRTLVKDNHLLGNFTLMGIDPAPRNVPQISVTMDVDVNGLITVKAVDEKTKKSKDIKITSQNRLTPEQVQKMKAEAEAHREEDQKRAKYIDTLNELESLVYEVSKCSKEDRYTKVMSEDEKKSIQDLTSSIESWLSSGSRDLSPSVGSDKAEDFKKKLQDLWYPIVSKTSSEGGAGQGPAGGAGFPGGFPGAGAQGGAAGAGSAGSGPTIEEVD